MSWQPIDTAPKDREICGAFRYGRDRWAFHHLWWNDQEDEWNDIYSDRIITPTHWQPLPEPPES